MKKFCAWGAALSLCGCTLLPLDEHRGAATIQSFKSAIQCEVAAVASDPRYEHFHLPKWFVKTSLDMTLVDTVSGDAGGVATVVSATLATISPSASLNGKFTHSGHVDFAIAVPEAIKIYGETCRGPDPSQTRLGLAAWIAATLDEIRPEHHGGLSYTVDVDVIASAGTRFGFIFSILNTVNTGGSYSREGVHHLVITMAEPTPMPPPTPVRVVGPVNVVEAKQADGEAGKKEKAARSAPDEGKPGERRPHTRHPALEDPNLNRMLQQQAPVRLAPGTSLR
ncbi:hypothetical protein ACQR16_20440 [Bradyrhizobium oligotrophicum]|uniref:hypothetical protein n=1 Tax=Bradyrhizobium oligotrophicum TaxID=44255 RepID=UPI003EB7A130